LLLVVGNHHPFASRTEISVSDLAEETFISLGDSSALAGQIQAFFGDNKFQPRIGVRCAQVATVKLFASMGLGISILPQLARLPDDRDTLTYLRLTGSEPTRQLVVIRHLQRYQSRGAEQFLAQLREHVAGRDTALSASGT
jgi:LysR family hydrogen peroxide-inducible transcriptional activator